MSEFKVNEQWLRGLSAPDRQEMKKLVVNNEKLLDKLKEMLYNIQVKKEETVLSDYDSPSWSHKQAHINGFNDALRKVIELVTVTERDDRPTI